MFFKIAFRNIWRNRLRTMITAGSIFFAVLFASFMNSFQKGSWERMLDNIIYFYYGYIQIHKNGYWEDKSIDNSMVFSEKLMKLPESIKGISGVTPRLESFALASVGNQTSGMLIVGTDPQKENELTNLEDRIIDGKYLTAGDSGIIIAEGVMQTLKTKVGDTLTLISQGFHGVNAAGMYKIAGIVRFTSPDLNKRMIYMPLSQAQIFFDAPEMVSSVALKLDNKNRMKFVQNELRKQFPENEYEIMNWKQMLPELVDAQKTDAAGNYIILVVLYGIIAFGIFGTILMMTVERRYEFGVQISIGMKRKFLAFIVWLETAMIGLIGSILGILGSIPLVYYFHINPINFSDYDDKMSGAFEKWGFDPIIPTAFQMDLFLYQALIVLLITTILAFYAVYKVMTLKPVEAMHG
ncbi:MAG: ABC transporter permease [Deltaproteobacteria bacterium]